MPHNFKWRRDEKKMYIRMYSLHYFIIIVVVILFYYIPLVFYKI